MRGALRGTSSPTKRFSETLKTMRTIVFRPKGQVRGLEHVVENRQKNYETVSKAMFVWLGALWAIALVFSPTYNVSFGASSSLMFLAPSLSIPYLDSVGSLEHVMAFMSARLAFSSYALWSSWSPSSTPFVRPSLGYFDVMDMTVVCSCVCVVLLERISGWRSAPRWILCVLITLCMFVHDEQRNVLFGLIAAAGLVMAVADTVRRPPADPRWFSAAAVGMVVIFVHHAFIMTRDVRACMKGFEGGIFHMMSAGYLQTLLSPSKSTYLLAALLPFTLVPAHAYLPDVDETCHESTLLTVPPVAIAMTHAVVAQSQLKILWANYK